MSMQTLTDFDSAPFEIIDGDRGKNYPKQHEFSDSGYCMFLSATNVTCNGFDFSQCQFITEQKDMENQELLCPLTGVIEKFEYISNPIDEQIKILHNQNIRLKKARDLLLPRLMHGEIAI